MEDITVKKEEKDIEPKNHFTKYQKSVATRVIDGIVSTALLMLAIYSFSEIYAGGSGIVTGALLALIAVSVLFQTIFSIGDKSKSKFVINLVFGAVFIVLSVLFFVFGLAYWVLLSYVMVYLASIILDRINLILLKRTVRNIIFNALIIALLIAFIVIVAIEKEDSHILFSLIGFVIAARALINIISLSFSQMKLKIILKITRKTFAAEIFFGLLLLIFAFALVFEVIEPNVKSYADALWYCFAVVTTIGFGDITVISPISRALSVILGIYGLIAVAVITSIIVNFYSEVKSENEEEPKSKKKIEGKEETDSK